MKKYIDSLLKGVIAVVISLIAYVYVSDMSELKAEDKNLKKRLYAVEQNMLTKEDTAEITNGIVALGDTLFDLQKELGNVKLALVRHDRNVKFETTIVNHWPKVPEYQIPSGMRAIPFKFPQEKKRKDIELPESPREIQ